MKNEFEFVRLVGSERRVADTLEGVSRHWKGNNERFLFISPHDDDVVLGGGLLIQLAQRENIPVHVLIVTDGSMGYCSDEEKENISEIRHKETMECFKMLGVPEDHVHWLDFPDCQLGSYRGKRIARDGEKGVIAGSTGLQNSFTYWLRKIKPTQCFLPTSSDLHPDHKITHEEFMISIFHAAGGIWPELGEPLEKEAYVHELGVYCDFPEPPQLRMKTSDAFLEKKLQAIAKFESQKQISSLIEVFRKSGPYEYLRALDFRFYQPTKYYDMFEKKYRMSFVR